MTKEEILAKWRTGDEERVALIIRERYGFNLSGEAVRLWKKGMRPTSKFNHIYENAARDLMHQRAEVA